MRWRRATYAILLLVFLSASCASVGQSDPLLVRADDLLVSSLDIYDATMTFHYANSARESPAVYRILEKARVDFPRAWMALYDGADEYRKNPDANKLLLLINAVNKIVNDLGTR